MDSDFTEARPIGPRFFIGQQLSTAQPHALLHLGCDEVGGHAGPHNLLVLHVLPWRSNWLRVGGDNVLSNEFFPALSDSEEWTGLADTLPAYDPGSGRHYTIMADWTTVSYDEIESENVTFNGINESYVVAPLDADIRDGVHVEWRGEWYVLRNKKRKSTHTNQWSVKRC